MANKEVYQAQCGACGFVLGQVEAPNTPIDATCKKCGEQKMGIKQVMVKERTSLDYNVFVSCKQTNQTLQSGFTIKPEELTASSEVEIKNLFVERCAQTMIEMFDRKSVGLMTKEVE